MVAHNKEDLVFMRAAHAASRSRGRSSLYLINVIICSFVIFALVWANYTHLPKVTRANGHVIPSQGIQVIQNLEGGIISNLYVREGDIVEAGQPLLQIDSTTALADFSELESASLHLKAAVVRMEAEKARLEEIDFPSDVVDGAPDAVSDQQAVFATRRAGLQAQLAVLDAQLAQKRQELVELNGRIANVSETITLAREELAFTEPLAQKGIVSQSNLLELRRRVVELEGEISSARLAIPRVQSSIAEFEARKVEVTSSFDSALSAELEAARSQLAALKQRMAAREDRLLRTEIRSPVSGVVNRIQRTSIGAVLQPGEDIMEIVPTEDSLLVEARVSPTDIAFLGVGQTAVVKVTAYDFARYGGVDGEVTQIAADTRQDEEGNPYYEVLVRTTSTYLAAGEQDLPIIPGMTTLVEIINGERTVLEYFIEPFSRARQQALTER